MKEIIVNNSEDKRTIAIVEDGIIVEKYEEYEELQRLEGNIYLGIIKNVLPGMQAAFVDIGDNKNSFLHLKDVLPKQSNQTGNKEEDLSKYNIKDYVKVGMPVIVEVKKDKTGKKGAKVSTNLNIAGKYVAIIPNSDFITISQKIEDKKEVERLSNIVKKAQVKNFGIIIRTSALNANEKEIHEDIKKNINIYENIINNAKKICYNKDFKPTLLYEKGNIIKRLLIDIGKQGLTKITVNSNNIYEEILELLNTHNINIDVENVKSENLFEVYNLQKQIQKANNRKVWLKCGGFITIDKTEALTAIDVNTGKFTGKKNIEQTILKVNKEATIEIAKQIRIRDIGGIIVIDYIDMDNKLDEENILNLLIESLKNDRAKTQVVGFSKLHLLEMTRKQICSGEDCITT